MNKLKSGFVLVAAALTLSSCMTAEQVDKVVSAAKPADQNLKALIVRDARDYLADPYSVRDAEISYVVTNPTTKNRNVCVKANAKNAFGGYTGRQTLGIGERDGRLIGNIPNAPFCSLPNLKWQPFPELEALKDL
jgi:hypothetical protein